ncbi:hypothetical protein Ahy_B09g098852 isoform E [Arachis hypogaea]|uniref:Uncharacterized protein n=1 Tax=Arachis hypogaea TaxID=3818 RepID=A0A444XT43_ARAHY|nr:hypothetical protein Ahy_B09g098852 isoform E [Arachis hypogaea]
MRSIMMDDEHSGFYLGGVHQSSVLSLDVVFAIACVVVNKRDYAISFPYLTYCNSFVLGTRMGYYFLLVPRLLGPIVDKWAAQKWSVTKLGLISPTRKQTINSSTTTLHRRLGANSRFVGFYARSLGNMSLTYVVCIGVSKIEVGFALLKVEIDPSIDLIVFILGEYQKEEKNKGKSLMSPFKCIELEIYGAR